MFGAFILSLSFGAAASEGATSACSVLSEPDAPPRPCWIPARAALGMSSDGTSNVRVTFWKAFSQRVFCEPVFGSVRNVLTSTSVAKVLAAFVEVIRSKSIDFVLERIASFTPARHQVFIAVSLSLSVCRISRFVFIFVKVFSRSRQDSFCSSACSSVVSH